MEGDAFLRYLIELTGSVQRLRNDWVYRLCADAEFHDSKVTTFFLA